MRSWPARPTRSVRIEVIPMIDVMMFLLVFFVLISINVLPNFGLKLALPQSSSAARLEEPRRVTVSITAQGALYLDGNPTSLSELPDLMRNLTALSKVSVIIEGDAHSPLQSVVDVLGAIQKGGVLSTAITTKAK